MAGAALRRYGRAQQLGLYERPASRQRGAARRARTREEPRLCAGCRAREARYGFRDEDPDDPGLERARTLCFECFRMELARRQAVAAHLARGWNGTQVLLPLAETLQTLDRRRRRAQIAARKALALR